MAALEQLSSDEDANEQMRDIATIKLASYKLDSDASREEITADGRRQQLGQYCS